LNETLERLVERAERLAESIRQEFRLEASVEESTAYLGGGSAPVEPLPTALVRVAPPYPASGHSEAGWARTLRLGDPAVVTRVQRGAVLFDLRAMTEADDRLVLEAIRSSARL
jgi:L-seryl-tRNA(Ser) seleniumtransferase